MNAHASINRIFRVIWNEALGSWVPVSEISRGRGKRHGRPAAVLAPLAVALGLGIGLPAHAAGVAPGAAPIPRAVSAASALSAPPAPNQLPTGATVVAGSATIAPGSTSGVAVLNIDQSTQRAVIDWNTFNLGSAAQVNFNQVNSSSATLNRVLDSNASQIFGKITATGQVFLLNPNGVYFGKSASVDVGSLAATTDSIGNADFIAGKSTFTRNGATGSVVNDGQLQAGLGGYIALLAPEVRNNGVVIAHLGTVAMASGESITLNFDGNHLAGITVKPSTIAALVENKGAVLAPGGLIILSAQAVDHLLGGVVNNSGTLEATGLATKGGRIVLEASDRIDNSGTMAANAGTDGSPAGSVALTAPAIENSGTISAAIVEPSAPGKTLSPEPGGSILLNAVTVVQTATGKLNASGANGGSIKITAVQDITVAGTISAAATASFTAMAADSGAIGNETGIPSAAGQGGGIALTAGHDVTLQSALVDASGGAAGGQIIVQGGGQSPSAPPLDPPTVALLGTTELRGSSRRGKGGSITLTGDRVALFDASVLDVSGATGGGEAFVGGGFHGKDPSVANAGQTLVASTATIDASATLTGDGGQVAVWSDGQTRFAGSISARGGAASGTGGFVEVSGKGNLEFVGTVDAGAAHGAAGMLLLDPQNITIDSSGAGTISPNPLTFATTPGTDSTIAPSTITALTNAGTSVTLQANNDLAINSSIVTAASGTAGALVFQAGRSIAVNASVISDNANISFTANDSGANAPYRAAGTATFANNSVIDAGSGTVSITMGTQGASGSIQTGHVAGANLTIAQNGPTGGAVNGAIDLGETDLTGNLTITASSDTNVTNTLGTTGNAGNVVVRGTASINVGAGNVTINGPHTDFSIIGLTAGNVTLNDTSAVEFATTSVSGTLSESTLGPIASTGSVQVAGTTTLTANNGGFGVGDPYINLTNAANHFGGAVTLSVNSTGATGTGGYATIRDSGAVAVASSNTAAYLAVQAGGAVTTTTISAGSSVAVTSSSGVVALGATTAGTSLSVSAAGAVSLGTTGLGTNLTISTSGAITNTGTLTVPQQTTLTAGAANNITLDNANNDFNSVQILSANNVTLVDKNAINFGYYYNTGGGYGSSISGNLSVTAGGDISQTGYNGGNYAPISVGGAATFTANNASAPINLWLGTNNPFNPGSASANNFAGTVTLARNNTNTGFSTVELRNVNSGASVLTGLTSVGTLAGVYLTFDNAPSVTLPGMTVTGNLEVYAGSVANTSTTPANIISQTGPIVVGAYTIMAAGSTGDIVLNNPANDFATFGIANTGARNLTLVDVNALQIYAPGYNQYITGNLSITTNGAITDVGNYFSIGGTAILNAGAANNITLTANTAWTGAVSITGMNVTINPWTNLILGNSTINGTLSITSHNYGYTLTQLAGSAVNVTANGTTTFGNFSSGITLAETGNVFGPLYIFQAGAISLRENAAITQAQGWSNYNNVGYNVNLVTSNDQAITLTQSGNYFGPLIITQVNTGSVSPGAVSVTENGDSISGMTQGGAWTVHGTTTLNSGSYSISLTNPNNVFGPLQVLATTGTTGTTPVASTVTIYAKNATTDAITEVGGTGAWSTGADVVSLVAYSSAGTAGQGNITLTNASNALGALYLKGNNVSITNNANITDGPSTIWDAASGASDTGWVTTGTTNLVVASPTGKTIALSNLSNLIGPISLSTTGTGTLTSVLVTDNDPITQAAVWTVGATPVTLDARAHAIDLSTYPNVLGAISINTVNGTPTSVAITENDAITQGSPWVLGSVPVALVAQGGNSITLTSATNAMGNLTVTGGVVSITENADITQGGAWTTTGTTTLNPTAHAITLANSANVLGNLAIAGTPSAVSISENDDVTQASAWIQAATPFTLNAGTHNIVLSQATNQLGSLALTAANATVTESGTAGISDAAGGAWVISGTTTLTAGTGNPIVLNGSANNDFGTVSIVSASTATIADVNGIIMGPSTIAAGGMLTVSAGGAITQSGAITAPSLRLIGTGNATLNNAANTVNNLAAGFTGGDLSFTNSGNFAVAVVGGTTGVAINSSNVTLTSVGGTVTGLSYVNASSGSLTLTTGTALSLPQMGIAGAQTYTAGGSGITLTAGINSSAAGAINFESPVTLLASLTVGSTNSPINFASTLAGGTKQLTVNAGTGTADFHGVVSALGQTTDASAALTLASGGATFDSTVGANNGLAITGPVTFSDTVTLGAGSAASVFTGLVTLGKVGGMNLSGNGLSFDAGVLLQNGPATINSNNLPLYFQTAGLVSGPYALTLNSGTAALTGLNRMGTNLTSLTVTALSPTIPAGGVSIAGPQTYTATAGSSITLSGNDSSSAAGTITFNSPVTVSATGGASILTSNSPVVFASTVDGNNNLTINSGTGTTTFTGAVGGVAPLGSGAGAAITLQGAGTTTFDSTVAARSGVTAAGPVTFDGNVTLTAGDTGSTFAGLVTAGGIGGDSISGFGGVAFNGGLALVGGPVSVTSNGGTLSFGGAVTGAQALTLNALAAGAGTVTGLNEIGTTSGLTALNVTAQTLSLPSTGLAVAGPMTFTAAGGITANGAIGSGSGPATGAITFAGPVILATGPITVTTNNAAINFGGSVDGIQSLAVNSGSGTTTFGAAVGGTTPLASLVTGTGGTTAITGGSIHTSGAQNYDDAVTLGAATTLTGLNVQFAGTLDGAYALTVNDSGTTAFAGVVGGTIPLVSITTDAPGSVDVNTTAITTTGAQTYHENMTLGANASLSGLGLTFGGTVDGSYGLTANAGSGALQFVGAVGATTPLTSLAATGNTVAAAGAATSGVQSYTGPAGITLSGTFGTTDSSVTVAGPATLGGDISIQTTGGNITFSGATSTINGDHNLTLTAGTGNVVLGGVVGGITQLAGITVSGNNLTLPDISTVGDANQSYTALNNITLNQSRTLSAPISFTAGGSFILLTGVSLTASNNTLSIQAADVDLQGTSTLSSGSGLMTLTAIPGNNIALGGFATGYSQAGQMTISGDELSRISTSGGLNLVTSGAGWVHVNGITAVQSGNIHGALDLVAQGSGDVSFITAASAFNAVTGDAVGGTITVGVNLSANNSPITFLTPVSVSGASTISSAGGAISFDSTLAVVNNLTLSTANGALTFGGAVGSTKTLTLNLGGGSVSGLGELQGTLTGLTVTGTSGITLPAFTINGPQVYNTGIITATGALGGVGLSFNNVVNVVPASGSTLIMNAGTGTLAFSNSVAFNANNITLTADQINFAAAVTGSGSLLMQPYTTGLNVEVGSSGTPITGLNLTHADMNWLPIGTLASLTIGSAAGTGTLDVGGALNAPGIPVTLNGGGGITQSGGSVVSGALTVYAAGNGIALNNGANAFGAVGINGTPSSVSMVNTLAINQLGTAAWNLGSAPVTLNAGTQDITLNNVGNTFGTIVLNGGNAQVAEAAATDIGASNLTKNLTVVSSGGIIFSGALATLGNVSLTSAGVVTQSAPLTIGGNLAVVTTVNAGDVVFDNSGAGATSIGNTLVGGDYTLTATNAPISQAAGASLEVAGHLTLTGASILLSGAGNLVGNGETLSHTSTVGTNVVDLSGVINLGNEVESGNLTVISEASSRTFSGSPVHGAAITLNNSSNDITGSISASASVPTIQAGGTDVQTGIVQAPGTTLSVAGVASFTAQPSSVANSGIITLSNAGNTFGTLLLSGSAVSVANSASGLTSIGGALATTNLTLTTAGGVVQTGAIVTPALGVTAAGPVTLNNANNDVGALNVVSGGNAISFVNSTDLVIAGIDAGGANASLTAGGAGSLTQTGALLNVGALTANAGGGLTLSNGGNTFVSLAASSAGTGMQVMDSNGVAVSGIVQSTTGDVILRAVGDLTLNAGGQLKALAGNVIASTEGAGNFINDSTALGAALVVGTGDRWLVYSDTPDLVGTAHTVKGGLVSNFRHYNSATYTTYAPGSVSETGNGFIYDYATPTLTVAATIVGAASQVYGDAPTGTLGYTISSGLVDSEDNVGNVIHGGTATYDHTLASLVNAGTYTIKYLNGLTSNYALQASATGATYTVTPAVLTYTASAASRAYGAVNPTLSGTLTGYKLADTSSVLAGTAAWTTTAVVGSGVGSYAINGSGYTLVSGTNYTFAQASGNATAFTVNQAGLTVTAVGATKTYDGLTYSGGNGVTYSGFANGDSFSSLGGTLVYGGSSQAARNAGTYAITPSGLTDGNYAINFVSGSLVVSRANLALTTSNVTKTYNGTLAALGTAMATAGTSLFGSDTVSGGTFAFTNANAGSGNKTVTVSGATVNDTNGGGNYNVSYVNNTTSSITPAGLTVDTSNVTKTYNGTLAANGTAAAVSGTLFHNASNGGTLDSLSGGIFAFTDASAGVSNKTVTTSGVTVSDGNSGGNYTVTYANNTTSTINQAPLVFSGTINERTYDGTTLATLSGDTLTGFIGTQTVTASAASANFADKNAGTLKSVTISGITLANGLNGGLASNYAVSATSTATGTIDPKVLTANATVANKVYDGTTSATLVTYGLSGFVGSETVLGVNTGTATFANKNVGNSKPVTISGITLVNGTNGGLATNYVVSTAGTSNADITPATLRVAGIVALDTVYNGTVAANVDTQGALLTGVIGSDNVQVGSITGTYTTKDVGVAKPITTSAFVLTGTDAIDYTLVQPTGLTANVTPRVLTVSATGVNKVYDTTTAATVILTDDPVAGDALTISSTDAFLDKNAGTGKYISVSEITLGGASAADYTVNSSTAAYANITPATLVVSAIGVNKMYDATTAATVNLTDTPLGNDAVTLVYGSASFGDKNAGLGKVVSVNGISASGAAASNYTISTVATSTADITPATITQVTGVTAANKVYDGNTAATLVTGSLGFVGMMAGDNLTATATDAVFNDKNAGTAKTVSIGGLVLGGTDAGNYILPATGPMTSTATITPAALLVSAIAQNKVYDGTTAATVSLTDNRIAGDTLTIASSDAFLNKNAGVGKYVSVSDITLSGQDAGNYAVNGTAAAYATITQAPLVVSVTGVNRVYNATTGATVTLGETALGSDAVSASYGSAAFANKNVGNGKTISVSGITLAGADAGNYSVNPSATTAADVTPATLVVGAIGSNKPYDAMTAATVVLTDDRFAGDQILLSHAPATFASPGVGSGKTITVAGIAINGGADRGDYVLADNSTTTTADIDVVVSEALAGTWSLVPVMPDRLTPTMLPAALAPSVTTPAISQLDLTLPTGFIGGTATAAATGQVTNGATPAANVAANDGQVTVVLVQAWTSQSPGIVSVSVPEEMVTAGRGFSFALPASLVEAAGGGKLQITQQNGKRLPSWLRYEPTSNRISAGAVQAGALPIELLVRSSTQRWILSISEHVGS
jgi:filamentous hemagglutinin family protein